MAAEKDNRREGSLWLPLAVCAALALIVTLYWTIAASEKRQETFSVQEMPTPIWSETYTWGSFDEMRMSRYYLVEDVPDSADVPCRDLDGNGLTWEFIEVRGPVEIDMGQVWEAVYRKLGD